MTEPKSCNLVLKTVVLITDAALSVLGIIFFQGEYLARENVPMLFGLTAASMLDGGRDPEVWGSIIINAGTHAISYDARAREGAPEGGWFTHTSKENGDMCQALFDSPWESDIWQEAFPQYKNYSADFLTAIHRTSFPIQRTAKFQQI